MFLLPTLAAHVTAVTIGGVKGLVRFDRWFYFFHQPKEVLVCIALGPVSNPFSTFEDDDLALKKAENL